MTISSETRTAGPFTGNGVTTAFPFAFKVFQASDVLAVKTLTASSTDTTLVNITDYTIALNADQNANPGGTLTLVAGALPVGYTLTLTSAVSNFQTLLLTNLGGFLPTVINDALDRTVILIQQILRGVNASLKFPLSDGTAVSPQLPGKALRAGQYLGFDVNGAPVAVGGSAVNGPYYTPTSAALPPTGMGVYAPSSSTLGIAAAGALALLVMNPASAVNYVQIQGGAAGTGGKPGFVKVEALGTDTSIHLNLHGKGTTTTAGGQYNSLINNLVNSGTTGEVRVYLAGQLTAKFTDTYWNPNVSYPGLPNGRLVFSSGWGDPTNSTDMISGVISVEGTGYPGTPSGCSLIIGSKGQFGEIHCIGNGALGHVTIDGPINANPGIADQYYAYVNNIRFAGAFGGPSYAGAFPQIKIEPSGHANDANIGLQLYNFAKGGYNFSSGNAGCSNLILKHTDNGYSSVNILPSVDGTNPVIYAGNISGNARLTLSGSDDAGVDICNRIGACKIASFSGGFLPTDWLIVTAATSAGVGPSITVGSSASNAALTIGTKGTSSLVLQVNSATVATFDNSKNLTLGTGGSLTAASVLVNGTTAPANGMYVVSANVLGFTSNSVLFAQYDTLSHALAGNSGVIAIGAVAAGPTATNFTGMDYASGGRIAVSGGHDLNIFTNGFGAANAVLISHVASAVNALNIVPAATGGGVTLQPGGASSDASIGMTLKTKGSSAVGIRFFDGGVQQAIIFGGSTVVNSFQLSGGATGNPPSISAQGEGTVGLLIYTAGSGNITFQTANTANTIMVLQNNGLVKFAAAGSFTANGSVATVLGSLGPVGSHTTVQKWLTIVDNGGTTGYVPVF